MKKWFIRYSLKHTYMHVCVCACKCKELTAAYMRMYVCMYVCICIVLTEAYIYIYIYIALTEACVTNGQVPQVDSQIIGRNESLSVAACMYVYMYVYTNRIIYIHIECLTLKSSVVMKIFPLLRVCMYICIHV